MGRPLATVRANASGDELTVKRIDGPIAYSGAPSSSKKTTRAHTKATVKIVHETQHVGVFLSVSRGKVEGGS